MIYIKKTKLGTTSVCIEETRNVYKILAGNVKERDHLEDVIVNSNVMLIKDLICSVY